MFVDQVEAILPSSGKGALDSLSFVINTMTDIIQPRLILLNQINLLLHAIVIATVCVFDVFVGGGSSSHKMVLGVLADAGSTETDEALRVGAEVSDRFVRVLLAVGLVVLHWKN